jgi:hypothetical protein
MEVGQMTNTNREHHKHNEHHDHHPGQQTNFTDPVCGMSTGMQGEFSRYDHDGKPYSSSTAIKK